MDRPACLILGGLIDAALGQLLGCIVRIEENTRNSSRELDDLLKLAQEWKEADVAASEADAES